MPSALQNAKRFFPKVESVSDGRRNVLIDVTSNDDKMSHKKDHNSCALAVACKRSKKLDGVIVSRKIMYLVKGKHATRYVISEAACREIVSFDRGGGFAPGRYQLNAPTSTARLGKYVEKRERDRSNEKPSFYRHITANIRTALGGKE